MGKWWWAGGASSSLLLLAGLFWVFPRGMQAAAGRILGKGSVMGRAAPSLWVSWASVRSWGENPWEFITFGFMARVIGGAELSSKS